MCKVDKTNINCDEGRRLGCLTFCCRLLVRLKPHEMEPGDGQTAAKGFVDKDPDGCCVNLDRENHNCKIWATRPEVCREYECNSDFLMQVVLRDGFVNLAETVKAASKAYIPKETFIKIPLREK